MGSIETLGDVIKFIEKTVPDINNADISTPDIIVPKEEKRADLLYRNALRTVVAPYSGFMMQGIKSAGFIAVTDDGSGVAQILAQKLQEKKINASVVDDLPDNADGLIYLGGLKKVSNKEDALLINRNAFLTVKDLADCFTKSGGIFITVQDTGGDFCLSGENGNRVWLSGLTGLAKTGAVEWPKVSVKAIDIDSKEKSAEKVADEILREILTGGPEIEVGIKQDGTRVRLESYPLAINLKETQNTIVIDNTDIIVASGGARGVTAKTLIQLAKETACSFVLLGRTPLVKEPEYCVNALTDRDLKQVLMENAKALGHKIVPAELGRESGAISAVREINATIRAMEDAGSKVKYVSVDVLDMPAVSEMLEAIRDEWGHVTGIVHGAGVLNDKLIEEKTPEQFDRVFNTKVKGIQSLLAATKKDPLKVICMFSSVAARFGNVGQCDYAMANEILNKVANNEALRRGKSCIVKSINWGPWDGGMVSSVLKSYFKELGIPLIPLEIGAKKFTEEIFENSSKNTEIVIGPKPPCGGLSVVTEKKGINVGISVNKDDYSFINSHKIKNIPVVPVVLALEWFLKLARLHRPDLSVTGCRDFKLLRGIKLENFNTEEENLIISSSMVSHEEGTAYFMELKSESGNILYYSATVLMAETKNDNIVAPDNSLKKELGEWSYKISEIYNDLLFHGPDFQVIDSLEGVSSIGASASISGIKEMNWPVKTWEADMAALDGGLQLALLWGAHNTKKPSLPTKIGAYHVCQEGPMDGNIRCELTGNITGNDRSVSDILFFDSKDKLVAKMQDVEMHMLSDLK